MTILEFIAMAFGGYGLGMLARSKRANRRARCEAHYWIEGRFNMYYRHCSERADRRCMNGFCVVHCRHSDRCAGACLKEHEEAMS